MSGCFSPSTGSVQARGSCQAVEVARLAVKVWTGQAVCTGQVLMPPCVYRHHPSGLSWTRWYPEGQLKSWRKVTVYPAQVSTMERSSWHSRSLCRDRVSIISGTTRRQRHLFGLRCAISSAHAVRNLRRMSLLRNVARVVADVPDFPIFRWLSSLTYL